MKRIAVAVVHGIEIEDPQFAAPAIELLREGFAEEVGRGGPDPEDALVIEPVNWAPDLEPLQRRLFEQIYPENTRPFFDEQLCRTIRQLNAGSRLALAPLAASLMQPVVPPLRSLYYPTARWIMIHFVGDVIAYDRAANPANYEAIHETFARSLAALARKAGEDAPLCVIAHSFGTVLASDYFYDLAQTETDGRSLVSQELFQAMGPSPLAHGKTLAWFYTMGSPLALWSLRYPKAELARPIGVPAKEIAERYPDLPGEWINFYCKSDVMAYPLKSLSDAYAHAVHEDRAVNPKGFPVSATPVSHAYYWSDRSVVRPIARTLARSWKQLNR